MKRIIFDIVKQNGTNLIQYPDDRSLFLNTSNDVNGRIIADYTGALVFEEYIEDGRTAKYKALNDKFDSDINMIESKYSKTEIASFEQKRSDALNYRDDNANGRTPYVNAMTNANPSARIPLLEAILTKVDVIATMEQSVLDKRDAIELATTQAELDLIVI